MSLAGGLLSTGLGALATYLVALIMPAFFPAWRFALPAWSLLAAAAMSLLVGAGASLYPAWRASHLDPLRALRETSRARACERTRLFLASGCSQPLAGPC